MRSRLGPYLLITGVGLLFFADLVLHPGQLLYSEHSDILAEHIPAKRFLVHSWQETGEIPLWCPYSFAGMPFIHDVQVAAFYPLHLPLVLLPEHVVGTALSWLIVLHLLIAGWGMVAYASSQGLDRPGALVAAFGTLLAGKWLMHLLAAGHYITVGLAWLPWVLLALEQAIRRGSILRATWAGAAFALIILSTHPQWTFYAGLLTGLWTLAPALEQAGFLGAPGPRSWRRTGAALGRWLGLGAWTVLVAVALSAIQLLPTLDVTPESSRAVGVATQDTILQEGYQLLLQLFGPPLAEMGWENRGRLDVLWLAAAVLAPVLRRGAVRYQAAVCLFLVLFALGGAVLFQRLPGFSLFRQPVRMLIVASFPLAYLAGVTTTALFADPAPSLIVRRRCLRLWVVALVAGLLLLGCHVLLFVAHGLPLGSRAYWVSLGVTTVLTLWLVSGPSRPGRRVQEWLWCGLLLANVWTLAQSLVEVRPGESIYDPSACVRYLAEQRAEYGRVLDRYVLNRQAVTPLGTGAPLAMIEQIESLRGYNPLDIRRYKEYLQFIMDEDAPIRPLESGLTYPIISDFLIINKPLLDLLGTRYLVQPANWHFDPDIHLHASGKPKPRTETEGARNPRWQQVLRDAHPQAYCFIAGGIQTMPPYLVYENHDVFPRAFVVPRAAPLPERSQVLAALKATDLREVVLLEGYEPAQETVAAAGGFRPAEIREYLPNRVTVHVEGKTPGYLVLADVWFPGWTAALDGRPVPLYRADYLFRAVTVPAGGHDVVFTFAPASYAWGKLTSAGALGILALGGLALLLSWLRRNPGVNGSDARTVHENSSSA